MDGVKVSGRLRELRTKYDGGKPISHAKLAEKLNKKYHVKISEQSLKDYERAAISGTTEKITKGNAVCGMRIEYLDMLADFYGVSADYILGRSDTRTPDVNKKAAMEYTGLSEAAVSGLHQFAEENKAHPGRPAPNPYDALLGCDGPVQGLRRDGKEVRAAEVFRMAMVEYLRERAAEPPPEALKAADDEISAEIFLISEKLAAYGYTAVPKQQVTDAILQTACDAMKALLREYGSLLREAAEHGED